MKIPFNGFALLLICLGLTACSKSRPSVAVLTDAINKTLPAHLVAVGKDHQFSPIKEVLGTTLPEGSYQIDLKTVVKAKEALYVLSSFSPLRKPVQLPDGLRAQLDEMRDVAEWSVWEQDRPKLLLFLVQMAKAKEEKEFWTKIIAEPRGAEWLVTVVEGEPQEAFSGYEPRAAFGPELVIYGSEEQQRNSAEVKAAYNEFNRRAVVLTSLEPAIKTLRKSETELSERYDREVCDVLQKVVLESREQSNEHDRRLSVITKVGDAANDNYKTRDRLINEEAQRSELVRKGIAEKIEELQNQRKLAQGRAHAEIEAKIKELKQQHGVGG